MSKEILYYKTKKVIDEIRRLERDMLTVQNTIMQDIDEAEKLKAYNGLSMDAATQGEYLALKLRELVYISSVANAPRTVLFENVANKLGISVQKLKGEVIEITIPALLPNRQRKTTDFITTPLYVALEQFVLGGSLRPPEQPFIRFKDCVICITHVYNGDFFGKGRYRDHDNVELKGIIDTINTFLLTDDNMVLCDIYTTHAISDKDCTLISIMQRDMFVDWYSTRKNGRQTPC